MSTSTPKRPQIIFTASASQSKKLANTHFAPGTRLCNTLSMILSHGPKSVARGCTAMIRSAGGGRLCSRSISWNSKVICCPKLRAVHSTKVGHQPLEASKSHPCARTAMAPSGRPRPTLSATKGSSMGASLKPPQNGMLSRSTPAASRGKPSKTPHSATSFKKALYAWSRSVGCWRRHSTLASPSASISAGNGAAGDAGTLSGDASWGAMPGEVST
mmetsp:Transcript_120275/g.340337  ORF Transcript_120275/g.340337 Transcript_120275/m.340337 type:complete len:216 (+) Transcript_120275:51-698(+)